MADLRTSILMDLKGNLDRRAQQFQRSMTRMARTGQRDLGRLRRVTQQLSTGLDRLGNRYTALATGVGGAVVGRFLVTFERRLTRLGIAADISDEKVAGLRDRIFEVARMEDVRVNPDAILEAVEAIIEKTGDLEFAMANIRNIGVGIGATGAEGTAIGEIVAELQKLDVNRAQDVLQIMDTMATQGKQGAFTLQNLAALGPRVVTAYSAIVNGGRPVIEQMREMGAVLQVIRQGTGSSEQAATAFEAVLRTLSDPTKLKLLRKGLGIQVFDPQALKEGKEQLRPLNELMVEILDKSKGRRTILGQIFDAEALRAFNAINPESMQRFMNATGTGETLMKDSARAAGDLAAALNSLSAAWRNVASGELAGTIQGVADALNSIDPKTLDRLIKVAVGGVLGVGALILASKTIKAGRTIGKAFRRGGAGGDAGGMLGGMAGVQPVWVVNMPGGPLGLPAPEGGGGAGRRGGRLGRLGGRLSKAAGGAATLGRTPLSRLPALGAGAIGTAALGVTAAGAAGYGVGTLISKAIEGTKVSDAIGSGIAHVLSAFGNDEARQSIERMDRFQGELKISIDQEGRARIRKVDNGGGPVDIDVDAGMLGVGAA